MAGHRFALWPALVLPDGVDIDFPQRGKLPALVQHIADSHGFRFIQRDGDDGVALQISRKDTAGDRIAVQPDHEIHDGGTVTDADALVYDLVAEQLLGVVGRFVKPLHKAEPGIGPQVNQRHAFLSGQRMLPAQKNVRFCCEQLMKREAVLFKGLFQDFF